MAAGWNKETIRKRLEDLQWMADTGECAEGAAERLGITRNALERWCERHAVEEWHRLARRDPLDHNKQLRTLGRTG
jgi:hypothetical protein